MARRYARDNRGRFAPKGTGATARGGRLRTASGKKRATQTMQASAAPKGTISKPKGLKPGAIKARPAAKTNAAGLTKAQFEAAAQKAWGTTPKGSTKKQKQSADQQLDRLATKSRNRVQSRTGLTKSDAMKASDLGRATGRRVEVSQTALGGYSIRVAPAAKNAARAAARTSNVNRDTAVVNIPMRGSRGRRLDAEISRNVAQQKAASRAASKAANRKFKSDQSRAKKLREVHEKAVVGKYSAKMGKPASEIRSAIRSMEPARQVKFFRQFVKENRATAAKARKV
jgi:hypothetical protein